MTFVLRLAIVLGTTEDECTVFADEREEVIAYAGFFPAPRVERIGPGHLVAVADDTDGAPRVVWRWFDAVVIGTDGASVRLWEPRHGTVRAQPRDAARKYRPGSRAYLSAGLPGAEWWVAGSVGGLAGGSAEGLADGVAEVDLAEVADVDLGEVARFLDDVLA